MSDEIGGQSTPHFEVLSEVRDHRAEQKAVLELPCAQVMLKARGTVGDTGLASTSAG